MATFASARRDGGVWRFSPRDATLATLAFLHAVVLIAFPSAAIIAAGVWWNSNTIAHNFIHRPFFRSTTLNRAFSLALSAMLGIPQTLWRDRHLAHHAEVPWRWRCSNMLIAETALVAALWAVLASRQSHFFFWVYLPGYSAGLLLCALQGHWEHAGGQATSYYGRLYNFLCFNDGYHAEHHANSSVHWTSLPRHVAVAAARSNWPPLLRWVSVNPLEILERAVLCSPRLQSFVLGRHRAAFRSLIPLLPPIGRIAVVGGGLYPRTALILRELVPGAEITLIDSNLSNLEVARRFLGDGIACRHETWRPGERLGYDLAVIPLCLNGARAPIYRDPPSPSVLVHDWIWRRSTSGIIVSILLLKRLNLVTK